MTDFSAGSRLGGCRLRAYSCFFFFFFNDTATTEIYTLSLHDALPISSCLPPSRRPSAAARACFSGPCATARDRKSTRLNSSHSQISYAVFCLKKKKNHHDHSSCTIVLYCVPIRRAPLHTPSLTSNRHT